MPHEIKNEVQRAAVTRMHTYAKSNIDTKVPASYATVIDTGTARYEIRGGERMWVNVATTDVFYVTLEDQKVQLTFIVQGSGSMLVSKRYLYGDRGSTAARSTRAVTYSSS